MALCVGIPSSDSVAVDTVTSSPTQDTSRTYQPGVLLRVRVLDPAGLPAQGATVLLTGTHRGNVVDVSGLTFIKGVPPGQRSLTVVYGFVRTETTVVIPSSDTAIVTLRASSAQPDRWVPESVSVSARVVVLVRSLPNNRPVRGIVVFVRDIAGSVHRVATDRKGRAVFASIFGGNVPVWTRDTLGYHGKVNTVIYDDGQTVRDTLLLSPVGAEVGQSQR